MLAGASIVEGVRNGAAEEDWDFKLATAVTPGRGLCSFGGLGGENHTALTEWESHGDDTADSAGSLNQGLVLLFLRYDAPNWAEGEGRTVCICGCSKGL